MRFLPQTPLRAIKTCTSLGRILSSVLVAGAMSLAVVPGISPARTATASGLTVERPFVDETNAAMAKMMAAMTIKPTGDVDRDFVAMMIPHHQGAIDMAEAELRYPRQEP